MNVEIVTTGTELLLGQIVNQNSVYLSQRLNELGFNVLYQSSVGDNFERMTNVFKSALSRVDILITSGGLGPTLGDITKEVSAQLLGRKMILHEPSKINLEEFFAHRHLAMSHNNFRQAMIPEGACVVVNERGTAPGVILEDEKAHKVIIHLPGPPKECEYMFDHGIVPYLVNRFGSQGLIRSRVLKSYGISEGTLEEKINPLVAEQSNPTIAMLVRDGEVLIRLTAKASDEAEANSLLDDMELKIQKVLGSWIYGYDNQTLQEVVGKLLMTKELTLAVAESCTGGMLGSRLTEIAGSSAYFEGGVISYSNEVKQDFLGVKQETLVHKGAVSEETAIQMAEGARKRLQTDLAIAITGLAGPNGATKTKPVGLVYIAVAGPKGTECSEYHFSGERNNIRHRTVLAGLNLLRNYVRTL